MAWDTRQVVELARTPAGVTDPYDTNVVAVRVAISRMAYVPVAMGSNMMAGDGTLEGRSRLRARVTVKCLGFNRTGTGGEYQSYGTMLRLIERVLFGPRTSHLYIRRAWEAGGDTDTPLKRDDYDRAGGTATTDDSLWNLSSAGEQQAGESYPYSPAGILPFHCVLDGEAEPSDNDDGTFDLEFTLYGVTPLA